MCSVIISNFVSVADLRNQMLLAAIECSCLGRFLGIVVMLKTAATSTKLESLVIALRP